MLMVRVVVEALQQQLAARRTALNRRRLMVSRLVRGIVRQTRRSLNFKVDLAEGMIIMEVWKMIVYGAAGNLPRIRSRLWETQAIVGGTSDNVEWGLSGRLSFETPTLASSHFPLLGARPFQPNDGSPPVLYLAPARHSLRSCISQFFNYYFLH
jgi:hypothetical protein